MYLLLVKLAKRMQKEIRSGTGGGGEVSKGNACNQFVVFQMSDHA